MAYFEYRGYKCYYEEYGKETKPRVIVVPDEGQNVTALFGFKEVLAPDTSVDYSTYRVTIVDFLGMGKSDVPRISVSDTYNDRALQLKELFYQGSYDSSVLIAVGEGGLIDGKNVEMKLNVGDRVLYTKYAGNEFKLDGEEYIIIKQTDILAVIK